MVCATRLERSPYRRASRTKAPCRAHRHSSPSSEALAALNDVVTVLRKRDLGTLRELVAPRTSEATAAGAVKKPSPSGRLQRAGYREGGVLVDFADVFDLGTRRMLPGNLLRRSQVLSAMRQPGGGYLVRQKITAKSGEEGTVLWEISASNRLVSCTEEVSGASESSGASGASSDSCVADASHPRNGPDAILSTYMTAMRRSDFIGAQEFTAWNHALYDGLDLHDIQGGRFAPAYRTRTEAFFAVENAGDTSAPYFSIPHCEEWIFADGVLVDQQRTVREVVVRAGRGGRGRSEWVHWAFELCICRSNVGIGLDTRHTHTHTLSLVLRASLVLPPGVLGRGCPQTPARSMIDRSINPSFHISFMLQSPVEASNGAHQTAPTWSSRPARKTTTRGRCRRCRQSVRYSPSARTPRTPPTRRRRPPSRPQTPRG